jgi:surface antigen
MSIPRNMPLFPLLAVFAFLGLAVPMHAAGDPPHWAPAHGYRHKHHKHDHHKHHDHDDDYPRYRQFRHDQRERYGDYGIHSGRCDTHAVAQVLGGVAGGALGGVLGSQVDQGGSTGTIVGAVAGTIIGAIIGKQIDQSMDPSDRYCAGRAFDFADDGHGVRWHNPQTRVDYLLTPLNSFQRDGSRCREFTTRISHAGLRDDVRQTACRLPNGDWQIHG